MTEPTDIEPFVTDAELELVAADQIQVASARIRAYCRWHIFPNVNTVLTMDGPGQRFAMLPSLHVTAVNLVTEDTVELLDTDYEWSASGQLWKAAGWTGHFRGLVVDFDHGYDDVPEEIRDVCIAVAKRLPAQLVGATQETAGGVSRTYGSLFDVDPFLPAERMELDRYRIFNRP